MIRRASDEMTGDVEVFSGVGVWHQSEAAGRALFHGDYDSLSEAEMVEFFARGMIERDHVATVLREHFRPYFSGSDPVRYVDEVEGDPSGLSTAHVSSKLREARDAGRVSEEDFVVLQSILDER